jgi:hypothetical protein
MLSLCQFSMGAPPSPARPLPRGYPNSPGSRLACKAIQAMIDSDCEEVVLEAEVTNTGALALYRALGFIRDKRLHRYGADRDEGRSGLAGVSAREGAGGESASGDCVCGAHAVMARTCACLRARCGHEGCACPPWLSVHEQQGPGSMLAAWATAACKGTVTALPVPRRGWQHTRARMCTQHLSPAHAVRPVQLAHHWFCALCPAAPDQVLPEWQRCVPAQASTASDRRDSAETCRARGKPWPGGARRPSCCCLMSCPSPSYPNPNAAASPCVSNAVKRWSWRTLTRPPTGTSRGRVAGNEGSRQAVSEVGWLHVP